MSQWFFKLEFSANKIFISGARKYFSKKELENSPAERKILERSESKLIIYNNIKSSIFVKLTLAMFII